jgi:hypothetical protein
MSLWGKSDTLASAPQFLSTDTNANRNIDKDNAFFVDTTEAAVPSNRAKGIKTPGWVLYKEYGTGRKYVETLVAMKVAAGATPAGPGDAGVANNTATEDAVVADRTLTISIQPVDLEVVDGAPAAFSVTAAAVPTSALTYQWQIQESGAGAWNPISLATSATYTINATVLANDNGDKYRVIVSAPGVASVTSNAATLNVTAAP